MSKPLPEKVQESYLLFRDDDGWKLLHPERGPCLVVAEQEMGIATALSFEKMVIGNVDSGVTILSDMDEEIESVKEQLIIDGYNKRDVKKMNLRYTNTVCFSY